MIHWLIYWCEYSQMFNYCRFNVPNEGKYRREVVAEFIGTLKEVNAEVEGYPRW